MQATVILPKITIRAYTKEDYALLSSWWVAHNEVAPEEKMMPDTSYILYINQEPILSVSLFLTNGTIAWIDNYIGNPDYKGSERKVAGHILLKHLEDVAKKQGKDRVFCMSVHEKTSERYKELGFTKTASNVSTFIKEIK